MGKDKRTEFKLSDLLLMALFPTLVGKGFILYFGYAYANHPGEGYGYALLGAIAFTVCMVGRFLWRYRHYED